MAKKYYLDEDGVKVLIQTIYNNLDTKADKIDLNEKVNKVDLDEYATKEDLQNIDVDLTGYATETYVNNAIKDFKNYDDTGLRDLINGLEAKTSGLYHYKGTIANLAALEEIQNPEVGDTYNLADTGMNVAWTGTEWDQFGTIFDDSELIKIDDIQSIAREELNAILFGGKSATVENLVELTTMLQNSEPKVEITLNKNVSLDDTAMRIPTGKEVVLKLNGNTIETGASTNIQVTGGKLTVKGGTVNGATGTPFLVNNGQLIVDGTNITGALNGIDVGGAKGSVVVNSGNITAKEVPVTVWDGASAIVNGGHLTGLDNFAIGGNGSPGRGDTNVTINGGIIEGKIKSAGYQAAAIYWPNTGTLTINGGSIISEGAGVVQRGGVVNINAGADINAKGAAGAVGKVGDSAVTVGSYAVVFDLSANYPGSPNMQLNIANGATLQGTDGDIQRLPADATGITDNR